MLWWSSKSVGHIILMCRLWLSSHIMKRNSASLIYLSTSERESCNIFKQTKPNKIRSRLFKKLETDLLLPDWSAHIHNVRAFMTLFLLTKTVVVKMPLPVAQKGHLSRDIKSNSSKWQQRFEFFCYLFLNIKVSIDQGKVYNRNTKQMKSWYFTR